MIHFLGTIAFLFLLGYVMLLIIQYCQSDDATDNVKPTIPADKMPQLRPLPMATAHQKDGLNKLMVLMLTVRKWRLTEPFTYKFAGTTYYIPAGFEFDGASIPKLLWAITSPVGLLLIPGLLHDFGYRYNGIFVLDEDDNPVWSTKINTKEGWDRLFRDVGDEVNQLPLLNALAEAALWLGGFAAWDAWRNADGQQPDFADIAKTGAAEKSAAVAPETQENDDNAEASDDESFVSGTTKTTTTGYINGNQQKVLGTRQVKGTAENQLAFKVECQVCKTVYGSNGSELYRRKCPECQGGKPSIEY